MRALDDRTELVDRSSRADQLIGSPLGGPGVGADAGDPVGVPAPPYHAGVAIDPWTDPYAVLDAGDGVDRLTGEVRPTEVTVAIGDQTETIVLESAPGSTAVEPSDPDVTVDSGDDEPEAIDHDGTEHHGIDDATAAGRSAAVPGFGQEEALNPAQQDVLALLGAKASERPQFDAELRHHLRAELEAGLAPILDQLPDDDPAVRQQVPAQPDPRLRGQVPGRAGRAVHLDAGHRPGLGVAQGGRAVAALGRRPRPLELVDEAIARLSFGSGSLADWLQTATTVDRAEVRAEANERVTKFLECFPPLKPAWRPVTESAAKVELFANRIVLQGRVDLTLGHTRGTTASKVLIDFKSGGSSPAHVDDLRFYALLETIRMGTPPRLVATYYLDSGRPFPEAITEGVLDAALHRTIDGARRMADLLHGQAVPVRRAGRSCRWCPMLDRCDDGQAWLRRADDDLDLASVDEDA